MSDKESNCTMCKYYNPRPLEMNGTCLRFPPQFISEGTFGGAIYAYPEVNQYNHICGEYSNDG